MADFDVAALSLASPPQSCPPATYTPAILVRNNGIHDAIATGWMSFYRKSTGVLVAQYNVQSGTIHPGSTGNATAGGTLDLSAEVVGAQFIVTGYVTTTNDQVPSNNQLAPLTLTISAEPPPPPPPVEAHASQHEDGGSDTISVEGLTGKLAEPQTAEAHASSHEPGGSDVLTGITPAAHAVSHGIGGSDPIAATAPLAHASSHEPGGSDEITGLEPAPHAATHSPEGGDEIDVTGLPGLLADPQTPTLHNTAHMLGGEDILNVAGLLGELADEQRPKAHAASHAPGQPDELTGIPPLAHASTHEPGGSDPISGIPPELHVTSHQDGGADMLNVGGLPGQLLDEQIPLPHDNTKHDPALPEFSDVSEITAARILIHNSDLSSHPNIAAKASNDAGEGTLLYGGGLFTLQRNLATAEEDGHGWIIHTRVGGLIVGNASLQVSSNAQLYWAGGSFYGFNKDPTYVAGSDGESLIFDSVITMKLDPGPPQFRIGGAGFCLYPAGPAAPNQLRDCRFEPAGPAPGEGFIVIVTLYVPAGDASNGVKLTEASIIITPTTE